MEPTETEVTSTGAGVASPSVTLQVSERGERSAEVHALLLHGYPDDRRMWDPVLARLPEDWHVVTPDNRGAGGSARPAGSAAYVLEELVEDVVAVLEATVPDGRPVHLVGHDWGSVIGWEVVAAATWDPRLAGRLASFTSVSGPSLDHVHTRLQTWAGRRAQHPQLLPSWYVYLFCVPRLPELLWGRLQGVVRRLLERRDPTLALLERGPGLLANALPGLGLYRANLRRTPARWRTSVPVLLVVARDDFFVRPESLVGLEARCRDLTRVEVATGHWVPRSDPERRAALVTDFARRHTAG